MNDAPTPLETIRAALSLCGRDELRILRAEIAGRDAALKRETERTVAAEIRRLARSIDARVDLKYALAKRGRPRRP